MRRRILGPEHPDTLATMHDVAGCYEGLGKHAEAEALYRQTLEIQRRLFGPEDPGSYRPWTTWLIRFGPRAERPKRSPY